MSANSRAEMLGIAGALAGVSIGVVAAGGMEGVTVGAGSVGSAGLDPNAIAVRWAVGVRFTISALVSYDRTVKSTAIPKAHTTPRASTARRICCVFFSGVDADNVAALSVLAVDGSIGLLGCFFDLIFVPY